MLGLSLPTLSYFPDKILNIITKRAQYNLQPNVDIFVESKNFIVKTAENYQEFTAALALRENVFLNELQGKKTQLGFEYDGFDLTADILIILDKESKKVIGTYRILCSLFTDKFYSASEFNLQRFLEYPGKKIELSRACINQEYRNGLTLSLLWKGIVQYLKKVNASYLFGCSTIWSSNLQDLVAVTEKLELLKAVDTTLDVSPLKEYQPKLPAVVAQLEAAHADPLLPPLLKAYLRAGAQVAPHAAFDPTFNCFDFFTVLKTKHINHQYEKRYL